MKWTSLALAVMGLCWISALRADDLTFTQKLTPEELHRAGLDKLTPDERAELDRLVAGAKTVTKTVTNTVVKEVVKTVEVPAAEPTTTAVSQRAAQSNSAAEAGGWLNWLHPKPKTKTEKATPPELVIVAHIVGKFYGWDPHSVFHLDNGQLWAVSDNTTHNLLHALMNPEVHITPQTPFGYLLQVPDADAQTRVRPVN